jgi:hypothetical protein
VPRLAELQLPLEAGARAQQQADLRGGQHEAQCQRCHRRDGQRLAALPGLRDLPHCGVAACAHGAGNGIDLIARARHHLAASASLHQRQRLARAAGLVQPHGLGQFCELGRHQTADTRRPLRQRRVDVLDALEPGHRLRNACHAAKVGCEVGVVARQEQAALAGLRVTQVDEDGLQLAQPRVQLDLALRFLAGAAHLLQQQQNGKYQPHEGHHKRCTDQVQKPLLPPSFPGVVQIHPARCS